VCERHAELQLRRGISCVDCDKSSVWIRLHVDSGSAWNLPVWRWLADSRPTNVLSAWRERSALFTGPKWTRWFLWSEQSPEVTCMGNGEFSQLISVKIQHLCLGFNSKWLPNSTIRHMDFSMATSLNGTFFFASNVLIGFACCLLHTSSLPDLEDRRYVPLSRRLPLADYTALFWDAQTLQSDNRIQNSLLHASNASPLVWNGESCKMQFHVNHISNAAQIQNLKTAKESRTNTRRR
jgi:hypothetical protein